MKMSYHDRSYSCQKDKNGILWTTDSYVTVNLIVQMNWTNGLKNKTYQNLARDRIEIWIAIYQRNWIYQKLSHKEISRPRWLHWQLYQTLKEETMPPLHKRFQKTHEEKGCPNPLCEVSTTLTPKPDHTHRTKES